MGLVGLLVAGLFGGFVIAMPFSLLAYSLSRHPAAQTAAALALLVAQLPTLNFVLFFAIVFARGIELAS